MTQFGKVIETKAKIKVFIHTFFRNSLKNWQKMRMNNKIHCFEGKFGLQFPKMNMIPLVINTIEIGAL